MSRLERPAILAGGVAVLFAIFAPLGASLIEAGLAASKSSALWSEVAISLVLSLVVVGGTIWLLRGRSRSAGSAFLSLFSVESVRESRREMVETPDPTSIEFESTFRDLTRAALGDHPARRLVLVVDNLDRVSPDDARSIWATLQTFLHHLGDKQERWLNSLWVLLPYDRVGIGRLWDGSDSRVGDESAPDESLSRAPLVDPFINKSIQVRFEVPLLLVSDWRTYLEATVELALPECDEADSYTAYRLFVHRLTDSDRGRALERLSSTSTGLVRSIADGSTPSPSRAWRTTPALESMAPRWPIVFVGALCLNRDQRTCSATKWTPISLRSRSTRTRNALASYCLVLSLIALSEGMLLTNSSSFSTDQGLGKHSCNHPSCRRAWELRSCSTQQPASQTCLNHNVLPTNGKRSYRFSLDRALLPRTGLRLRSTRGLSGLLSLLPRNPASNIANRATRTPILEGDAAEWAHGAHHLLGRFEWLALQASGEPLAISIVLAHFATLENSAAYAPRLRVEPSTRTMLDNLIVEQITQEADSAANALSVLHNTEPDFDREPFRVAAASRLRNDAPSRGVEPQPGANESSALMRILRIEGQSASHEWAAPVEEGVALETSGLRIKTATVRHSESGSARN